MINRPRGTRDLLPEEMEIRKRLEGIFRRTCENFGYREILTPTFEHTELFTERSGPSIMKNLYAFKDKSGRELSLRPEFTAPVIRAYVEGLRERPKPLKLYYFGPTFRYERPQAGRYREFWQFGTELIGPDTPRADAENIALAYECMKKAGLEDFKLNISHLGILETFFKERNISEEAGEIYHAIDNGSLDDIECDSGLKEELETILDSDIEEVKGILDDYSSVDYLQEVLSCLEDYGIGSDKYDVDLSTVRGLDYYKGVVFEFEAESLGAEKQICGGGDYTLGDIFGVDVSSKGFAIGFDRTLIALEKEGKAGEVSRDTCYLIPIGEESTEYAYELLSTLRDNGIPTDVELMDRSVGKSLSYADRAGFKYSILIGEDEVKKNSVTIKNMTSGEQSTIERDTILEVLGQYETC